VVSALRTLGLNPPPRGARERRRRASNWVERGGDVPWLRSTDPSGPLRGEKTHYAASLVSAADQQIPDDTRVVLEELITETGR
jgi:hypothetical protein